MPVLVSGLAVGLAVGENVYVFAVCTTIPANPLADNRFDKVTRFASRIFETPESVRLDTLRV